MIRNTIIRIIYAIFRALFPLNKRKILFFSYYGEQYSGSPKYLSRYLEKNSDMKIVWAFTDAGRHSAYRGKTVRYGRPGYYFQLATCGTIVTNYRMTKEFVKREGQVYVQTWHSSLRLKMIEKDAEGSLPDNYIRMAKKDSASIDLLLAGSGKSADIFRNAFWYDGRIAETGTPQCDCLFNGTDENREKVFRHFGIPEGARVLLYAPTFRKSGDLSVYALDTGELRKTLSETFGGEWYILMRLHPHLSGRSDIFRYNAHTLNATAYDDVQELLCAADVLISDYSAVMFDYSLTDRPCFLFATDLDTYTASDRKLYFDIRQLPFPLAQSNQELLDRIKAFDSERYSLALKDFMKEIRSYDDGHACERVCGFIKEALSK